MVVNLMKMNSCNMTIKTIVVIKIITLIEGAVYNLLFLNHCLYELQINFNSNNFDEDYNLHSPLGKGYSETLASKWRIQNI